MIERSTHQNRIFVDVLRYIRHEQDAGADNEGGAKHGQAERPADVMILWQVDQPRNHTRCGTRHCEKTKLQY